MAARWFRTALAAGPVDKAAAHCDLAESYLAVGEAPQAKRQVLAALEVAPSYARAQDLLLDARGRGPVMRRRALLLASAVVAALAVAVPSAPDAIAQGQPGAHLAGLQWTFVRIKYTAHFRPGQQLPLRLLGRALGHRRARPPSRTCRDGSRR